MNYRHFLPSNAPPSPVDLSSPPLRKGKELQINTKGTDHSRNPQPWTPPVSPPFASSFHEKSLSFNVSRRKSRQSQQSQQMDIDHLTLENAKLHRANRLLKVDREQWLEERIRPLEQHIRDLTASSIRWQRAAYLLQQELEEYHGQMAEWKLDQTLQKTGPEYEFLVNMIHQLQSQISVAHKTHGVSSPIDISNSELFVLLDKIHCLEQDLDLALAQLTERDKDLAYCRSEISIKEQVVDALQAKFDNMDKQVKSLQYMLQEGKIVTPAEAPLPTIQTTPEEMTMMLKATSRTRNKRKMATNKKEDKQKDRQVGIEIMKSAYQHIEPPPTQSLSSTFTTTVPDRNRTHTEHRSMVSTSKESLSNQNTTLLSSPIHHASSPAILLPLNAMLPIVLPGSYPVLSPITTYHLHTTLENYGSWTGRLRFLGHIPFAPFIITSWALDLITKLGITYDCLTCIIVLTLITGILGREP